MKYHRLSQDQLNSVYKQFVFFLSSKGIDKKLWDRIKKEESSKTKKVAAIGIRVKKWIAFHGFSINITNDLEVYKNIVPCGIYSKEITNLCSVKKNNYKYINQKIINNFLKIFGKLEYIKYYNLQ